MFENLTEKLQRTFKNLRGQGKLTDEHLDVALAEIREALLEGDVNVGVADELLANIRAKAIGSEVMLQLSPDQQVVKSRSRRTRGHAWQARQAIFASRPPSVWMIVGLQGSGKTTTTGKLAKWLSQHGHRPLVVSTDVYRPAAREQLAQVAKAVGHRSLARHWHGQAARNRQRRHQGSKAFRQRRCWWTPPAACTSTMT